MITNSTNRAFSDAFIATNLCDDLHLSKHDGGSVFFAMCNMHLLLSFFSMRRPLYYCGI
jgi:hypothetical protein